MKQDINTVCPHCNAPLDRWSNPQVSTWAGEFQFVCFNDDCPYFVRGWLWMTQRYNVHASYRWRVDPETGDSGALPVWSDDALKTGIVPREETVNAN